MPRYQYNQTHQQSCSAVAIMITMAELGVIQPHDVCKALEFGIWGNCKRSDVAGEEEIFPAQAMLSLRSKGALAEIYQDKTITAGLKQAAAQDYQQYKAGLANNGIQRNGKIDLSSCFNDDARIFVIVGFMGQGKLLTHTVLMRKDQGSIWVMNPDGGTDTQYGDGEIATFLAGQTAPVTFAGRAYLCAGIAIRVSLV